MARILAIGDIHGCLTALDTLLGFVQPTPDDQLIFLGDYIDRGPDSKGVLDRLIELKQTRQIVCLRGNHEVMMLAGREGRDDFRFWMSFGGMEALGSYAEPGAGVSLETFRMNIGISFATHVWIGTRSIRTSSFTRICIPISRLTSNRANGCTGEH